MVKEINTGSDFSGVGAFDQALARLGVKQNKIFACDWDKYARQTYIKNYGMPLYYPNDVYDREIPKEPLGIYMTSPPCQAFSRSGKRLGEKDKRGVLFYNSHEFITINNPLSFVFENVPGLLSDDKGRTFKRWLDLLGGKSVNGNDVLFPHPESVPYHIYWWTANAKDFGIPQNRERVFIVGIRDDQENNFNFPKPVPLVKCLRDILEPNVDPKYFLSEKAIKGLVKHTLEQRDKGNSFGVGFVNENDIANTIKQRYYKDGNECLLSFKYTYEEIINIGIDPKVLGYSRDKKGKVVKRNQNDLFGTIHTATGGGGNTDQFVLLDKEAKTFADLVGTIRRVTPRECFRLMGFPDTFEWDVSDTQAYRQAGNSIVVDVLAEILRKLLKL